MAKNIIHRQFLKDPTGADWSNKSMTTVVGTYYTQAINNHLTTGFASLLVLRSAGTLAITFECSDNGLDWYIPYDTVGTALNVVYAVLNANRWIVFSPQVAEYIRFKFVLTAANATVTAIYRHQERL